jgi:IS5 family transposase
LAAVGFAQYRKHLQPQRLLADMNRVVPWDPLVDLIAPEDPKGEGVGRRPVGLERMLRIYCLQQWFNPFRTYLAPIADRLYAGNTRVPPRPY